MIKSSVEKVSLSSGFKLVVGLLSLFFLIGCGGSSDSVSDHTHLWVEGESQNVWSYDRATVVTAENRDDPLPDAFLKTEISSGQKILLESGQVVSYDGEQLRIGKTPVKTKHVHVERDGSIRENAFIRGR